MFLNKLNKKEKKAFLKIAYYIANINHNFDDIQKKLILDYSHEMQITSFKYKKESFSLKKTLKNIKSKKAKKIILLELMALVYSDSIVDEKERIILNKIIKEFKINKSILPIYEEWIKAILALSSQGEKLIQL